MKTVAGIFDSQIVADKAVAELLDAGFTKDDISLIMSEQTRNTFFSTTDDETNRAARGATVGATMGVVLGALIAGLTAAGALVTSGGSLLLSGPMVAILSGAGAGGVTGGLAGALVRAGFATNEASRYEEEIKRGKAVVVVHADNEERASRAKGALQHSGAVLKAA